MSDEKVVELATAREGKATLEELAADYRKRAETHLNALVTLLREADRDGFLIEFSIQRDQTGRQFLIGPAISKRF